MRFREGDRVVVCDPDGTCDCVRGIWYPHGKIGGTILQIELNSARIEWDCDVDEYFVGCGSWIDLDYLMFEPDVEIEIDDAIFQFIDSM
jgi:hypothetical protein